MSCAEGSLEKIEVLLTKEHWEMKGAKVEMFSKKRKPNTTENVSVGS